MPLTVPSPKTEHHEDREARVIPIFLELVQPLQEAWDLADEGPDLPDGPEENTNLCET